MSEKPVFENAPGITLRPRSDGQWEARWQARTDLVKRGYEPKSCRLWCGFVPTDFERQWVSDRCNIIQHDMLNWARGGLPEGPIPFDGTIHTLIFAYQRDALSTYKKLRYQTRVNHDTLLRRIDREIGSVRLADVKARTIIGWHEGWVGPERKLSIAHSLIGQIRALAGYGASFLEDPECERICGLLGRQRFEMPKRGTVYMTADQANDIRRKAHESLQPRHSIALAEAFQFDCMFRQKDVIGEWVPNSEPGLTDVAYGNEKWLRGLRWEEIDANLILKHTTSKRQKDVEIDLKLAPMVIDELTWLYPGAIATVDGNLVFNRSRLPERGPIVIMESTGYPWIAHEFRQQFRIIARAAGVPDDVKNMHSRSGGITEATLAGASLEHVQHMATHSDIKTTQGYSRAQAEKTVIVMQARLEHRNKSGK